MAIVKSEGIILRSKKYSETSLILDVFTLKFGLRSMIVSGVRKSKSRAKAGLYQVMNIVDFVFYDNEKESLCRIKEAKLEVLYGEISRNVIKSSIGMMMTEIARNAIFEKTANESLYLFVKHWFLFLDKTNEGLANFPIKFMLDFSAILGFQPIDNFGEQKQLFDTYEAQFVSHDKSNQYCVDPELSGIISSFLKTDKTSLLVLQLNRTQRSLVLDKLIQFYQLHIESFKDLKSITILRQVLS